MKKIALFILFLFLVFCGCTGPQKNAVLETPQGQGVSVDDENGYILKSFDYYHNNGSVFNTFEFLQNPTDAKDKYLFAGEKFGFRFIDKDGRLYLENMCNFGKSQYYDMYGFFAYEHGFFPNEQCSDAITFLCDEEAIKECFFKNGVRDIREIMILGLMDHKTGYIAVALTENEAYYMPIPIAEAEYGDYIYQKVYTSEEFKKIYSPREASVYIDGKKMESPSTTLLGEKYLEMDILSFLEALGYECKYDPEKQEITVGKEKIKFEYNEEKTSHRNEYEEFLKCAPVYDVTIYKPEPSDNMNWAVLQNGRFLANARVIEGFCYMSGYEIEYRFDDMSVHIFKK